MFQEERERLEKWADDIMLSVERDLSETKMQIKKVRRMSRVAVTLDKQDEILKKLKDLENCQRKQRRAIFQHEDEIAEKRDTMINRWNEG